MSLEETMVELANKKNAYVIEHAILFSSYYLSKTASTKG